MIEYSNFEMKEELLLGEKPRSERMFHYVRGEMGIKNKGVVPYSFSPKVQ